MRSGLRFGVACLALALSPIGTFAKGGGQLFQDLAGVWSGGGSISLTGGGTEPLRCRATYSPSGATQLSLSILCASSSAKLDITSSLSKQGDRIVGSWSESTFGVSGGVSGVVSGQSIEATVRGGDTSAHLSLHAHGNTQSVTIVSEGQISGSASVVLRRN